MQQVNYPNWIEINLSAIEHNTRTIIKLTNKPLMAVVKANAYGFGSVEVGKAALSAGATYLAVARYCEAEVLREAGLTAPILILGMVSPDEVEQVIAHKLTLTLFSHEYADMLAQKASEVNGRITVHLKVDTGMSRLGVFPHEIVSLAKHVLSKGNLDIEGVYSHFANATTPDHPGTITQTDHFTSAVKSLEAANLLPKYVHLANSAGSYYEKESWFNMVRAGSAVTGIGFRDDVPFPNDIKRVITWKVRLAVSKVLPAGTGISYGHHYVTSGEEIIGTLPLGYGDGFRRLPGNHVLIDGQRVPIVGTLCMDQCMIRLPKTYPFGTEVVVIGTQGNESITLEDLAKLYNTPEVDIASSLNQRIPRIYTRS